MVTIQGKTIIIPKGDRGSICFHIRTGAPSDNTPVEFTMDKLIHKSLVCQNANVNLSLTGTDTNHPPGTYQYSLRICHEEGYDTPICTGNFIISEVVEHG